jgi:hypothetical protein
MSEKEFHSCEDAFFLSTRNGLILVVKQLTKFVEAVLHAFTKGVHDSEERLRKAGFASFATLKDSTKLNVTQRVLNKHDYPDHIYDGTDVRFVPVILTNSGCSFCEGYLINLLWNRPSIRPTGEFPVGTNKKGVNSAYGDVNLSHIHPGCLYIHSVHAKIGLEENNEQLEAHKQGAIDRRDANKENQPPIKTQPIDSFFSMSKIPSQENSTLTQKQVEEKLEEELFPETVEILLESETKEDLNSMISSLQKGGTEVPHVSDDTYQKLRSRRYNEVANENTRKRAAGEDVPTCAKAPPVKLLTSQRAVNGRRSCLAPNCPKPIQFFLKDGSGEGWCVKCAPADNSLSRQCSHPDCTQKKVFEGKCKKHCDKTKPEYIAMLRKDAEAAKRRRAKAK